jgi:hypothetical protein
MKHLMPHARSSNAIVSGWASLVLRSALLANGQLFRAIGDKRWRQIRVKAVKAFWGRSLTTPHFKLPVSVPWLFRRQLSANNFDTRIKYPRQFAPHRTASIYFWETDHCRPRDANLTALCKVLKLPIRATRAMAEA